MPQTCGMPTAWHATHYLPTAWHSTRRLCQSESTGSFVSFTAPGEIADLYDAWLWLWEWGIITAPLFSRSGFGRQNSAISVSEWASFIWSLLPPLWLVRSLLFNLFAEIECLVKCAMSWWHACSLQVKKLRTCHMLWILPYTKKCRFSCRRKASCGIGWKYFVMVILYARINVTKKRFVSSFV